MAQKMNIGQIGALSTVLKRKFRWTFQVDDAIDSWYVRMAGRPNLTFEELELNFLNEKVYISGKPTWETITVTMIDVKENDPLHQWFLDVYDYNKGLDGTAEMGDPAEEYKKTGTLTMFDGHGATLEKWTLRQMWPQSINWGDLDYSSSETQDIEVTMRYDGATRSKS